MRLSIGEIVHRFAANGALVAVIDIAAESLAVLVQDDEAHQRNPDQP